MAEKWIWAPTVDDKIPLPQYIRLVNERMRKLQATLLSDSQNTSQSVLLSSAKALESSDNTSQSVLISTATTNASAGASENVSQSLLISGSGSQNTSQSVILSTLTSKSSSAHGA